MVSDLHQLCLSRAPSADNELQTAQDRFWNLSKTWSGLQHKFFTLRNGLKLHYLSTDVTQTSTNGVAADKKYLLIFIHGFPDSWILWRYLLPSASLQANATLVALDLPGYGGSDSFPTFGATAILEALTEFIVGMKEEHPNTKVCIIGHDWGCILAFRLAAEAPSVADRFILSNGPLVGIRLPCLAQSLITDTLNLARTVRKQSRSPCLILA